MPARVAVLHHRRSAVPLELAEEIGDAAELLWVLEEEAPPDAKLTRALGDLGVSVTLPKGDLAAATRTLARYRPEGIVSLVDEHLVWASELAERLSLPFHATDVARALVDKRRQRALLARAGLAGPPFWSMPARRNEEEVRALAGQITFPVFAKPAEGSGSVGIELVGDGAQLRRFVAAHPGEALVFEGYLPYDAPSSLGFSREFCVESAVCAGRAGHIALTGRFPLAEAFRQTGSFAPAAVSPETATAAFGLADDAIGALGIETGLVRTTLKQTPEGLALIGVDGRLGCRPPFVLNAAAELDLLRVACQLAVGRRVAFRRPVACRGVGFAFALQAPRRARRVLAVTGAEAVAHRAGIDDVAILRAPGEPVDWRLGNDAAVVSIHGHVDSHRELAATVAELQRSVCVAYELEDKASRSGTRASTFGRSPSPERRRSTPRTVVPDRERSAPAPAVRAASGESPHGLSAPC